jgi:DNA mismatch endonuclease (patch repair protein)
VVDFLSKEKRSWVMSRIRGKNTGPERQVARVLRQMGLGFRQHVRDLPGIPDFVFATAKVAVFVHGDFWHGWRLPAWKDRLPPYWKQKLEENRRRDRRKFARLRKEGWQVVRIWDHELNQGQEKWINRVWGMIAGRSSFDGRAVRTPTRRSRSHPSVRSRSGAESRSH